MLLEPNRPRTRLPAGERRQQIVRAVLDLAREHSPDAITTQAIAARIGVTQGALFRHFPDKQAIWLAVFAWVRTSLGAALEAAGAEAASPLETLEHIFCAHVALVGANPGLPRILFHELQAAGDSPVRGAVRTMVASYRRRLARLVEAAKAAGEVPHALDTGLATVLFIGAVQGLVIDAALGASETRLAKRAAPMFALLRDGYRNGDPAGRRASRRESGARRRR